MFRPTCVVYGLFLSLAVVLTACTPRFVREAQTVVTDADSLWHNGQMYVIDAGDSATLAEAYQRLDRVQAIFPDEFAHSCYHYGRLLRKKDNPVEAMQAFLAATHSRTSDYHILGRVYSNMGDICHLAGEYNLSYDMFEKSAEMYLCNGDTLLYYYDLNNMAFELAEMKDSSACMTLLQQYSHIQEISDVSLITRAELYCKTQHYDSAIYYSYAALSRNAFSIIYIQLAQAYSYLGIKDSAVYYAQRVATISTDLWELDNALYILYNDDEYISKSDILKTASDRADILKLLEIRQGQLSQAVQLLEQDLQRKPDLLWLYSTIAILFLLGTGIIIYVHYKRKKQKLITQQIEVLEQVTLEMQKKHNELSDSYLTYHQRIVDEINNRCLVLQTGESIKQKLAWRNYAKLCKIVDKQFYMLATKLRDRYSLKETEIRMCILTLLYCKNDMMAELLYKSPTSIGTMKRRVANKLGTASINLRSYLIDNVCLK